MECVIGPIHDTAKMEKGTCHVVFGCQGACRIQHAIWVALCGSNDEFAACKTDFTILTILWVIDQGINSACVVAAHSQIQSDLIPGYTV